MSSAKNVGRKRLGRLPILGGKSNTNTDRKRPCQIESRTYNENEKVPRLSSPNLSNEDLSFSASFACDLESDLDLMSALDKMEKAYGYGAAGRQNNPNPTENLKTTSENTSVKRTSHKVNKSSTVKNDAVAYKTPNLANAGQRSTKGSAHKENDKDLSSRQSHRKSVNNTFPVRLSTANSFINSPAGLQDDSLWSSPVGMSTPQNPAPTKSRRTALNSSKENTSLSSSKNQKRDVKTNKSILPKEAKILKTPVQASTRVTRSSSKKSTTGTGRHKSVLSGLDGNRDTPVRAADTGKHNRSDFFKSLFIDNTSFEDISNLEAQPKKKNITESKKSIKNGDTNDSGRKGSAKRLPENLASHKTNSNIRSLEKQVTDTGNKPNSENNTKAIARPNEESRNGIVKTTSPGVETGDAERADVGATVAAAESSTMGDGDDVSTVNGEKAGVGSYINIQPGADQLALSSWGLPEPVLKQYQQRGITHMFPWQAECLLQGNVLGGGNLVYSAPTSAGKTMVAELLVLKRVMETRKKAIIILPFVSVSREKMFYLQELYQDAGIRVSGFMGSHAPAGGFSNVDVAVCTIEKGNGIINRCLEDGKLSQIGILVVDELHLIGDPHRGYLLELLLTKIAYMVKKSQQNAKQDIPPISIQVVGMSATLPNLDLLARWLDADLYRTDYRPVPLTECVKIGTALYDSSMSLIRDIDVTYQVKGDTDHVVPLCIETIRGGHSILIFCPTKNWCEKLAETVARELYNLLKNPAVAVTSTKGFTKASELLVIPLDQAALRDVVEQLKRTPVGVDPVLGRTVPLGVAYHHAGLTFDERDIVEGAFRQGALKVLIATSTLSSGVNLPARRVLVRTPVFHGNIIDFLTYKQMIGRAGRKGVDTAGESILLCKPSERAKAAKLLGGELPPVHSTLIRDKGEELSSSMKRAILEVVVSGVAMAPADVAAYASCTLLAASLPATGQDIQGASSGSQTEQLIEQCIAFLQENEFVTAQTFTDSKGETMERFVPTQLGGAVLASSLSPDEGLLVFSELQRARSCFVLENELHIVYQVTPIYAQGIGDSIDWYQYFCIWEALSPGMKKVAELAGVRESYLARAVQGRVPAKTGAQLQQLRIHRRFYTALALHDLVQEVPLPEVARKFNCNKGQLQSLQQAAATFAGMVTVFCARLGWSNLELILSQFQNRLTFGVQRELCDLVRVSALNGQRARVMFNAGYQTVAALAGAHPADIEALLKNSAPFQSKKRQDQETDWDVQERCKAQCIFLTGRRGVTEAEAAEAIIGEAKALIQEELGGVGVQWRSGHMAGQPGTPQLGASVLTSPISVGRTKSVTGKRRSKSAGRLSTSPNNAGDSRQAVPCVVSPPPPPEKQPKHPPAVVSGQEVAAVMSIPQLPKQAQSKPTTSRAHSILKPTERHDKTENENNAEGFQSECLQTAITAREPPLLSVETKKASLANKSGSTNQESTVSVETNKSNVAKPSVDMQHSDVACTVQNTKAPTKSIASNSDKLESSTGQQTTPVIQSLGTNMKKSACDTVCGKEGSNDIEVSKENVKKAHAIQTVHHRETTDLGKERKTLPQPESRAVIQESVEPGSSARNNCLNNGNISTNASINTAPRTGSCPLSTTTKHTTEKGSCKTNEASVLTADSELKNSEITVRVETLQKSKAIAEHAVKTADNQKHKPPAQSVAATLPESTAMVRMETSEQENLRIIPQVMPGTKDGNPDIATNKVTLGRVEEKIEASVYNEETVTDSYVNKKVCTAMSRPPSGSGCHVVEEDFADSFLIDTQVELEIGHKSTRTSNSTHNLEKSKKDPNNRSQDKQPQVHQICDASLNESVNNVAENKATHEQSGDIITVEELESQNGNVLLETANKEQETATEKAEDEILFSDESDFDLGNSRFQNTSAREQNSAVSVDSACNELDMNIADRSGYMSGDMSGDMFDKSEDLIAASNYDHFGMSGEARTQNIADDSYQDLHIPYQSGQERCFEGADRHHPKADSVRSVVINNIGGSNGIVLGQFSSQMPKQSTNYTSLQEDLAVAMEMGESFGNTFSETRSDSGNVAAVADCGRARSEANMKEAGDNIGDSLTFSMMEQALDEPETSNSHVRNSKTVAKGKEKKSKHSCDNVNDLDRKLDENNDNEMNCDQSVIKRNMKSNEHEINCQTNANAFQSDQISTSVLNCFTDDTFISPTKAPNKRLRETPVTRKQKLQKTEHVTSLPNTTMRNTHFCLEAEMSVKHSSDSAKSEDQMRRLGRSKASVEGFEAEMSVMHSNDCAKSDDQMQRSSKSKASVEGEGISPEKQDTINISDYVPPTPPGDDSIIELTPGQPETPKRTPYSSLGASSMFSPKLKAIAAARQGKQIKSKTDQSNSDGKSTKENNSSTRSTDSSKQSKREKNKEKSNSKNKKVTQEKTNKLSESTSKSKGDKSVKDKLINNKGSDVDNENVAENRDNYVLGNADDNVEDNVADADGYDVNEDDDKLSPSFIDPDESGLPLTQASFTIIDVCADKRLFKTFILEWRTKTRYAVSLACEKKHHTPAGGGIGANFRKDCSPSKAAADIGGIPLDSEGHVIVGVAVSWDNRDAYFVSFTHDDPQGDPDDSLAPPPSDPDISLSIRMKAVKSVLQQGTCKGEPVTMVTFDTKAHYRAFVEGCGFTPQGRFEDPKIACWLLDPGAREKTLHRMVTNLLPTETHMLHGIGGGIGVGSLGMSPENPGSGRYRATTESVLVRHLGEYFLRCLEKEGLYNTFTDVEMPSAVTLCRMELNGFGFSHEESEHQKGIMVAKLSALEEQAYTLAGHPFSLSATDDVAQVLYTELLLPPSGDPTAGPITRSLAPAGSLRGGARKGRGPRGGQLSTSKDVLEKLKKLHPLPGVILEWRRITNALTKTVFPLQKEKVLCERLSMHRIYGDCQLHTATGRVSLTEPNLQNVPKDFEITMPDLIGESPPPNSVGPNARRSRGGGGKLRHMIGPRQVAMVTDDNNGTKFSVSMRHAFIPFAGGVLLAADYSQLELRMIAHLSGDKKLIGVLNADGDVFKLITAQWKNIKPDEVTPEERAQAKQVCYGMIYGIGPKALSEQLEVEENDAAVFIETFKAKYPGMRTYLRKTVESCREKGYVQTMLGRKRYLPQITAGNPHARAQAERQAVNTTVQGSAADLVKMAANKIDQRLAEVFPMTSYTHRHRINSRVASTLSTPPEGAWLVLQLHDELIYEVSEVAVFQVARIVRESMETVFKLPVKMPVKVKVGPSWGKLEENDL